MAYIRANPTDVSLQQYGTWPVGLPQIPWEFISFQPYTGSTQGAEVAAILAMFSAATLNNPVALIYEGWPSTVDFGANYQTWWAQPVVDAPATASILKRQFFEHVCSSVRATLGDRRAFIIPSGEVFNEIDIQARAGKIPGVATVADLYRDAIHMGDVGRFVAASTILATFHQHRTTVAANLASFAIGLGTVPLTLPLAQQMEAIVWSVVSTYAFSGVA